MGLDTCRCISNSSDKFLINCLTKKPISTVKLLLNSEPAHKVDPIRYLKPLKVEYL